jgi:hypothetical protein
MLERIADNPWPCFGALIACFAVVAWYYFRTGDRRCLWTAIALILAAISPLVLALVLDTPQKQVRKLVQGLADAAEKGRTNTIIAAIAPSYHHEGLTYDRLIALLRTEFANASLDSVAINELHVDVAGESAVADLEAVVSGRYNAQGTPIAVPRYFVTVTLTLRRDAEGWRITEIRRFEPGSNPRRAIGLTSR